MEQQGTSGLTEREIAQLIQYHKVSTGQAVCHSPLSSSSLFQFQSVYQVDRREEADPLMVVDNRLHTQGGCQVSFPRTRTANQNNILGLLDKLTPMKQAHQRLRHDALGKIEAGEIPMSRELGNLHLVVD